jgi:hypothetical protein
MNRLSLVNKHLIVDEVMIGDALPAYQDHSQELGFSEKRSKMSEAPSTMQSSRAVSRRSFMGVGSAALVTAAFSGKADGQMRQQDSA